MFSSMGRLSQLISPQALFFEALVALVVITSLLGRPKRLATSTDFPAPLGAKLIVWALMVFWMILLVAPLASGMYWLAAIFAIGPAYTIWRWPDTISIDELQISRDSHGVTLECLFIGTRSNQIPRPETCLS